MPLASKGSVRRGRKLETVTPLYRRSLIRDPHHEPSCPVRHRAVVLARRALRPRPGQRPVDPAGKLVYAGGIDSIPSSNPADIAKATNYVNQSLAEALAGKPISQPVTRAYGCSVKYGDAG